MITDGRRRSQPPVGVDPPVHRPAVDTSHHEAFGRVISAAASLVTQCDRQTSCGTIEGIPLPTSLLRSDRRRRRILVLIFIVASALAAVYVLHVAADQGALKFLRPTFHGLQLGPLAGWVSGLVSAFALMTAIISFRNQADRGEKDHVRGVAAWLHPLARNDNTLEIRGLDPDSPGVYLVLQNTTSNPIFSLSVKIEEGSKDREAFTLRRSVWPPKAVRAWPVVVPADSEKDQWQAIEGRRLLFEFTDSFGRKWRQDVG